jgi:hypothetical protein
LQKARRDDVRDLVNDVRRAVAVDDLGELLARYTVLVVLDIPFWCRANTIIVEMDSADHVFSGCV